MDIADYPYGWMDSPGTPLEVRERVNKDRYKGDPATKTLRDTCAALRAALEPFAKSAESSIDESDGPDDQDTWEHSVGMGVTLGDYRRALQAFNSLPVPAESAICIASLRARESSHDG